MFIDRFHLCFNDRNSFPPDASIALERTERKADKLFVDILAELTKIN